MYSLKLHFEQELDKNLQNEILSNNRKCHLENRNMFTKKSTKWTQTVMYTNMIHLGEYQS